MNDVTCEALGCSEPTDKIDDGHNFCARHNIGDRYEHVAIVSCAVDGCGCPVAPGSRWCSHHHPHMQRQAA